MGIFQAFSPPPPPSTAAQRAAVAAALCDRAAARNARREASNKAAAMQWKKDLQATRKRAEIKSVMPNRTAKSFPGGASVMDARMQRIMAMSAFAAQTRCESETTTPDVVVKQTPVVPVSNPKRIPTSAPVVPVRRTVQVMAMSTVAAKSSAKPLTGAAYVMDARMQRIMARSTLAVQKQRSEASKSTMDSEPVTVTPDVVVRKTRVTTPVSIPKWMAKSLRGLPMQSTVNVEPISTGTVVSEMNKTKSVSKTVRTTVKQTAFTAEIGQMTEEEMQGVVRPNMVEAVQRVWKTMSEAMQKRVKEDVEKVKQMDGTVASTGVGALLAAVVFKK